MLSSNKLLSLACYLSKFHKIEKNNRWWGKGLLNGQQVSLAGKYLLSARYL